MDDEQRLMSTTQFIDQFFPIFDTVKVSQKYAAKHGLDPAEVVCQWQKKGRKAREIGTNVHWYAECLLTEKRLPEPQNGAEEAFFRSVNMAVVRLLKRFEFIASEKIVFSPQWMIAGTIDLLMRDQNNGDVILFDWKTNEKIERDNFWQSALPPIEDLPRCAWSKYQLQLNLYQIILSDERYFPRGTNYRKVIIHLEPEGVKWLKAKDLSRKIRAMLTHFIDI